jgi:glycosyltransferase involved in cell wall biosynthesis
MWPGVRAMPGITGTIITFNEESRIAEAIASLSCCDEVIVVDSGSTDRTRDLARARGARVIEHPWEGFAKQKNFAAGHARHDWILSIDADERLSIELAGEIAHWKKSSESLGVAAVDSLASSSERAWAMPRRVFYLGKWIRHSGWYPDRKTRLYDKRSCRWEGDFVHEWVSVPGGVRTFNGDLLHFPFHDWKDHSARIERYTELAAQAARSKGSRGSMLKLLLAPPLTFVKGFLLQAGFLDGWRGLAIAYMGARYVFRREFRILR